MKTLKVTLKQHTPLIHFQHDQYGATLRASEVKPKLDRFILTKLGNGDYELGCELVKEKGWLIGKGTHPALNYKIQVKTKDEIDLSLQNKINSNRKHTTEDFPLLLANMGGRDSVDELVNFSMYKIVYLEIFCLKDDLRERMKNYIPFFFAKTNFGQRSNKGFGSFTVTYMDDDKGIVSVNTLGDDPYIIPENTWYMDFSLNETMYTLQGQKCLFKIIDSFWKKLRKQINDDRSVICVDIASTESYIKAMKVIPVDDNIERIPAPIIFKPISYKEGKCFSVYIMFDEDMLAKLRHQYPGRVALDNNHTLNASNISSFSYIDNFISELVDSKYENWRVNIERGKNVFVEFYEQ